MILLVFISLFALAALCVVISVEKANRREKELYELLSKHIEKGKEELAKIVPDSRDLERPEDDEKDLSWQRLDEKKREKAR